MATLAILLWLAVVPVVFVLRPVVSALLCAVLIPYLLLPEAFAIELPGLPDLDKTAVISIGLMMGLMLFRDKFAQADAKVPMVLSGRMFRATILFFLVILVFSVVLSVLNNRESLQFGPRWVPGLRPWDGISLLGSLTFFLIPFLFARRYLATPQAHRELLVGLAISGLCYTSLMLIEIRLSPQLHNWVYGFHQHSFIQHVRDGYRPKVFLQHGLWVGFYMLMAFLATLALWKAEKNVKWLWAALWLFALLFLSKNFGATAIALLMAGIFFWTWPYMQVRIVAVIAICVLVFPALRQAHLIPTDHIVSLAAKVSQSRADSLGFRLDNEDALLARALEKPLTGWGPFGREQIFRESDGKQLSVSEGRWTQTIGVQGWIGYIGLFGLLTLPLIALKFARKRKQAPPETIVLALIAAGNLIYMIPNSTLTPVGWLVFGALAGFVQYDSKAATPEDEDKPAKKPPRATQYTRFPDGVTKQRTARDKQLQRPARA